MLFQNSVYFSQLVAGWGKESPYAERQYLNQPDNEAPKETGYNEDDFAEMERDDPI